MNYDEFAFFNQQLANMLKDGLPLSGALEQLCRDMGRGATRSDFEALARDLAEGVPLAEAVERRRLPKLYVWMVKVGERANNLPRVLQMLADHYHQASDLWTRLKGLLFYPVLVLLLCLALSLFLSLWLLPSLEDFVRDPAFPPYWRVPIRGWRVVAPPALLVLALVALGVLAGLRAVRDWARWRLPAFREASVAQLASTLALMLRGGCTMGEALDLLCEAERGTPVENDLALMAERQAAGASDFAALADGRRELPKLFVWMVAQGGEDLAGGLERAAQLYHTRASHHTEMLLYAALPCSILVLAAVIFTQLSAVLLPIITLMKAMSY